MEQRQLGRTGHMSSLVIYGGAALGQSTQDEALEALESAAAAGVNHIDVAPSYGHAETLMGPWLEQNRARVFLGCKTTERDRDGAWRELEQSLKNLRVEQLDLHQFHAVTRFDELDAIFAPGGAFEAFQQAREQGLTRYLGITGHGMDAPAIQLAALERYPLDTVMFPLNPVLYARPDFRRDAEALLAACGERGVGVMIIKSITKQPWGDQERRFNTWYEPYEEQASIENGVRFALSQPNVTAIPAAGDTRLLSRVLKAVGDFQPMPAEEQQVLIEQSAALDVIF
ncbi:MAG: aldo/keto reductase [Anaerolineae bacterium]